MSAPRVLVIEDDPEIRNLLSLYLRREGYAAVAVATGAEGLKAARQDGADLVILDLMLPDMDGLEVCQRLRAATDVPVLMLTARTDVADRVRGFAVGAEDYVPKPFAAEELLARVRALLRRAGRIRQPRVAFGAFALDAQRGLVTVAGQEVPLTRKEFELLTVLAAHPGRPFTRAQLIETAWGYDAEVEERAVDTCVTRVRRKLAVAARGHHLGVRLETVWGLGYRLTVAERAETAKLQEDGGPGDADHPA
jgi:DNA-binding response OmpR family regulator